MTLRTAARPGLLAFAVALVAGTGEASDLPKAPPTIERSCTRDTDCAVAKIEVSGPRVCCAACQTTPGTKRWYAALQRYCGSHPSAACPALACPLGPTRAICRGGLCEATATGEDGKPTVVMDARRCLPAKSCERWVGCALVFGNSQDGWFVEEANQTARGEPARLEKVCAGADCRDVARLDPPGISCSATASAPPSPPPASCFMDGAHCRPRPGR